MKEKINWKEVRSVIWYTCLFIWTIAWLAIPIEDLESANNRIQVLMFFSICHAIYTDGLTDKVTEMYYIFWHHSHGGHK